LRQHFISLPLILFWSLYCGSDTWRGGDGIYKTLSLCAAEGKKQVERADARKEEYERDSVAIQRAHPGKTLATSEDYNVGWECIPSDGSAPTYGGYWLIKKP
jgi:hypothetical protein